MTRHDFVALPDAPAYTLGNARVPACCIDLRRSVQNATDSSGGLTSQEWQPCLDGVVTVDIEVSGPRIAAIRPARAAAAKGNEAYLDVQESMVLPAFVDLHTHIGGLPNSMLPLHEQRGAYAVYAPLMCLPACEIG
jgi:imidazolonepropionase-like amidohydrolase